MDSVLYIDDNPLDLEVFNLTYGKKYKIFVSSNTTEALKILEKQPIKVAITDQHLAGEKGIDFIEAVKDRFNNINFIILSADPNFFVAKRALLSSRVNNYILKPWDETELEHYIDEAIKQYNQFSEPVTKIAEKQSTSCKAIKKEKTKPLVLDAIITKNNNFRQTIEKIKTIANSDAAVLVTGETGTGKELIAKAIHNQSSRRENEFVSVNCAAIPENLFESELFGYEKGAFTGADSKKKGKFEIASGGTLFLDELGEIPLNLQAKLLRAIQENEICPIGSNKPVKLNLRIISATNRNLEEEIKNNTFRSDLYYRLSVYPVELPALRKRKDDIPVLAQFFMKHFTEKYSKEIDSISSCAMNDLCRYQWPGNIRELENVIERSVLLCNQKELVLSNQLCGSKVSPNNNCTSLSEIEKDHILKVLNDTNGQIGGKNGAAEILDLNRTTLIAKMKKLGIK